MPGGRRAGSDQSITQAFRDLYWGFMEHMANDRYIFDPATDRYLDQTSRRLRQMPGAAKDALTKDLVLVADVCCNPAKYCDKAVQIKNAVSSKVRDIRSAPDPTKAALEAGKECCIRVLVSLKDGTVQYLGELTSEDPEVSGQALGKGWYQTTKGAVVAKGCEAAVAKAKELLKTGGLADDIILNTSGQGTPVSGTCRTNAELVQEIGRRAEAWGVREGLRSGPVAGTLKHDYARRVLDRYQDMFGQRGLSPEVRYLAGRPWRRGQPLLGSVRLDVVENPLDPTRVWDYKFGTSHLTPGRIDQIRSGAGLGATIPITEVKP